MGKSTKESAALGAIIQEVYEELGMGEVHSNLVESSDDGIVRVELIGLQMSLAVHLALLGKGYVSVGSEQGGFNGFVAFKRIGNMTPDEIGECLVGMLQGADPLIRRGATTTNPLSFNTHESLMHILSGLRPLIQQASEELQSLH